MEISSVTTTAPIATPSPVTQEAVLRLTNRIRVKAGRRPVKANSKLRKAAQGHAQDMATHDYFSHTSRDGRSWDRRIRNAKYTKPAGENIAYGQDDAAEVMRAWMNSPGHKRNILDPNFRYMGVGYVAKGDYWVQDFGY